MSTLKSFVQSSTDAFVKFNEEVAKRMGDLNIDSKYSDELLGAVHHVRDKNQLYVEVYHFWTTVKGELKGESPLVDNDIVLDGLDELENKMQDVYCRRHEVSESKVVNWLSGVEDVADGMASSFYEVGQATEGRVKSSFELLSKFLEDFQSLEKGENSTDLQYFTPFWDTFRTEFLGDNS